MRQSVQAETGFILLIVLVWLTILTFLTTQIVAATHTSVLISANIRNNAAAEAQADGAVSRAIFQILIHRWAADGAPHLVQSNQSVTEIRVYNETGRIDPNVTPPGLMAALLQECGAAPKVAADLAAAIIEWRSLDLLQTSANTAISRYRAAGRDYAPPNKRFLSVDELELVLGMTSGLLTCLKPHLSVHSLAIPSQQTANDPVVKRAITTAYPYDAPQIMDAPLNEIAVIRITAQVDMTNGTHFHRVAVVRVATADPNEDFVYRVLSWEGSHG